MVLKGPKPIYDHGREGLFPAFYIFFRYWISLNMEIMVFPTIKDRLQTIKKSLLDHSILIRPEKIRFRVLDHFTENSFHQIFWAKGNLTEHRLTECHLTEIGPNRRLTERRLTGSSFYRKVIWPIFFSENGHLTESTFGKKCHLTEKNCAQGRLTENSFDWKFIWPKAFSENDHLTESFFRKMVIWPNVFFLKNGRFRKIVIWPTVHIPLE
jgi:hypothetical protein